MSKGAFEGQATRIGELGFPAWTDVSRRKSIADLIFNKAKRCGVYVLGFANGERYVGLSTDVVKRFGQHRLAVLTGDIDSFTFQKIAKKDLPRVEREVHPCAGGARNPATESRSHERRER